MQNQPRSMERGWFVIGHVFYGHVQDANVMRM